MQNPNQIQKFQTPQQTKEEADPPKKTNYTNRQLPQSPQGNRQCQKPPDRAEGSDSLTDLANAKKQWALQNQRPRHAPPKKKQSNKKRPTRKFVKTQNHQISTINAKTADHCRQYNLRAASENMFFDSSEENKNIGTTNNVVVTNPVDINHPNIEWAIYAIMAIKVAELLLGIYREYQHKMKKRYHKDNENP